MDKNPFKPPFSPTIKLVFFSTLLLLSIIAYVIINDKIESGQWTAETHEFVDLSCCEYEELENDRIKLTVPGDYAGNATTQEQLNETAKELGYESIILNENGSVTYTITNDQHKEMLDNLRTGINQTLNAMIGSEDYNKITAIEPNDDFTYIKVSLSSKDINYNNSMSMIQFKTYHLLYSAFNGTPDADLNVEYYNKEGELVLKLGPEDIN